MWVGAQCGKPQKVGKVIFRIDYKQTEHFNDSHSIILDTVRPYLNG